MFADILHILQNLVKTGEMSKILSLNIDDKKYTFDITKIILLLFCVLWF